MKDLESVCVEWFLALSAKITNIKTILSKELAKRTIIRAIEINSFYLRKVALKKKNNPLFLLEIHSPIAHMHKLY